MRERRRAYPLTNIEHQAYCVMQWLSGVTQREIAAQFGYIGATQVHYAIVRFNSAMDAWDDRDATCKSYHGESRDAARRALTKFLAERAAQPGSVGAEWMRL